MKGIVFTKFLEMVESQFSPEVMEQIIEDANLPSGGSYTAVGTYDHAEISEGLIIGCIKHYGENIDLKREDSEGGTSARFILTERR